MEEENNNMENTNTFKSVNNNMQNPKRRGGFKNSVVIPFVSGLLGATLVVGLCFGVPEIKEKLVEADDGEATISNSTSVNATAVSLEDYSDTAIAVAAKVLPSIVGIEIEYNVSSMFGNNTTSSASGSGIIISEDRIYFD